MPRIRSRIYSKAGSIFGTHGTDEPEFYGDVAKSVAESQKILIVGPSSAKRNSSNTWKSMCPKSAHITGVETMDHDQQPDCRRRTPATSHRKIRMEPQKG